MVSFTLLLVNLKCQAGSNTDISTSCNEVMRLFERALMRQLSDKYLADGNAACTEAEFVDFAVGAIPKECKFQ